jgi:hypothetical protein
MGLIESIVALPLPVLLGIAFAAYVGYLFYEYSRSGNHAFGTRPRPDLKHHPKAKPIIGDMLHVAGG